MRKYVFRLYNYILHVYDGRPGGYPEALLNKIKTDHTSFGPKDPSIGVLMSGSPMLHVKFTKGNVVCHYTFYPQISCHCVTYQLFWGQGLY